MALIGMRFHVQVGILPHERQFAQPLDADLVVRHAHRTEVLDYRVLYDMTRSTIEAGPLLYLEAIAELLVARALGVDGVHWCRVALRKPHVALGGPLDYAQIAIERSRE